MTYTVHAKWSDKAKVWWTDGEDIPGLTLQADTFDELVDLALTLGPEMLRDNKVEDIGSVISIAVVAERHGSKCIAA